ncbi:unnamed protein product [Trichobilharzia regenti]|nr:unnamed protein product [Trichobilharzia regenti]
MFNASVEEEMFSAGDALPKLDSRVELYEMDCPAALERIKEGRPITIKDDKQNVNKCIADTVSIHPDLRELYETISRLSILPSDFEGKDKVKIWLDKMDQMQASDELSEAEVRQMLFDLDSSYNAFNRTLHSGQ